LSHIYHFCATLPGDEYVHRKPEFIVKPSEPVRIILPLSVDITVREARGQKSDWVSEKHAKKDAAFEAYVALYKAGLVDHHLLPLLRHKSSDDNDLVGQVEKRPAMVRVDAQMNPWIEVAQDWTNRVDDSCIRKSLLTVMDGDCNVLSSMVMMLPRDVPRLPPIRLHWSSNTERVITLKTLTDQRISEENTIQQGNEQTFAILSSVYGHRFIIRSEANFVVLFHFNRAPEDLQPIPASRQPVTSLNQILERKSTIGLIRDPQSTPYIFNHWLERKPPEEMVKHCYKDYSQVPEEIPHLALSRLSKRADFMHPLPTSDNQPPASRHSYVLPVPICTMDDIPCEQVQTALLIPSIMHRLQVYLVADKLTKTILADVGFDDLSLVVTAISASVAREEMSYQRLEFLGDSLLKVCTSIHLLAEYPQWHEGYLSHKKDTLVANARLARAAIKSGLPNFILTKPFTGNKWRPVYVDELIAATSDEPKREISSKVLADVVEALIGAAKMDGGITKVLACLKVFLPEIEWQSLDIKRALIFHQVPGETLLPSYLHKEGSKEYITRDIVETRKLPPTLEPLEELIGYHFQKKSLLLESMTHASCDSGAASLERLEFLGDSVLDHLVVNAIYSLEMELPPADMHLMRTALVNADFLAFICMEWSIGQLTGDVIEDEISNTYRVLRSTTSFPLWKFMRYNSLELSMYFPNHWLNIALWY
jgi:dsRNA-specific ribonuclease